MSEQKTKSYLYSATQIRTQLLSSLTSTMDGDQAKAEKALHETEELMEILSFSEACGCTIHRDYPSMVPALWWLGMYRNLGQDELPFRFSEKLEDIVASDPSLCQLTQHVTKAYYERHEQMKDGQDPIGDEIMAHMRQTRLQQSVSRKAKMILKRR